eukprot:1319401-Amphidinium_carterae.1
MQSSPEEITPLSFWRAMVLNATVVFVHKSCQKRGLCEKPVPISKTLQELDCWKSPTLALLVLDLIRDVLDWFSKPRSLRADTGDKWDLKRHVHDALRKV